MKRDLHRKLDPETMLALAKNRQRQERRSVSYLIAAAVLVVGLGVIAWFLWPEDPERVLLAAYDAVAKPDEDIVLSARVEPETKGRSTNLNGLELRFQVVRTQTDKTQATDAGGSAALDWQAPAKNEKAVEFMVRHQPKDDPRHALREQARVFIWPAKSKLLVVDVDHALTEGVESLAGNLAPTLRAGAAVALRSLSGRYKIVYLSARANEPSRYRKLRAWLQQVQLPDGPLLGPSVSVGPGDVNTFTIGQIENLKNRFSEPAVGVVGRAVEAQMVLDAGWKAIVIGDANGLLAGANSVATWAEFPKE